MMVHLTPAVTFILALLATIATASSVTAKIRGDRTEVCQTSECLALSALIVRNMNLTADPCEDFGAYACGSYDLNTLYDPASVTWSSDNEPMIIQGGLDVIRMQLSKRVFEMLFSERTVRSNDPDVNDMYTLSRDLFRSCASWVNKRNREKAWNNGREVSRLFFNGVLTHLLDSIDAKAQSFERALAKMVRFAIWPMFRFGPSYSMMRGGASNASRVRLSFRPASSSNLNFTIYSQFFSPLSAASDLDFSSPREFAKIARELTDSVISDDNSTSAGTDLRRWKNCSAAAKFLQVDQSEFTIRQLDSLSRCADPVNPFSWLQFLEGVLDGNVDEDMPIDLGSLNVANNLINLTKYFKARAFDKRGKFSVHFSFLVFDWLLGFGYFLPTDLAAEWEKHPIRRRFTPSLDGDPISECMIITKWQLSPVFERMFQKAYHAETFDHVSSMVELIRNATIQSLRQQSWITPSAKLEIVDKIVALKRDIGFDALSAQQLKSMYNSTIRAFKAGNYSRSYRDFGLLMSLSMCAYAGRLNYLLAADSPTSILAGSDTLTVNAFNYVRKNTIVFPMGILSPFLYHRSYPDYMNLGGIGVIIGHEIGHGFDNMGHEISKLGATGHFWDNETEAGFIKRMECVKSRFAGYELVPGRPHSSESTVGNDISDLIGIQSAFGAMKMLGERGRRARLPNLPEILTPERLFFVQAAQAWCTKAEPSALADRFGRRYMAHSPPHIRIRGMMENSRDFARTFACRRDQAMNPRDKCEFW